MVGKRKKQTALFDVGNVFDLELDAGSFHAQLATAGPGLFSDELFADLYSADRGRPSVPPSQMALLMLLQYHARVSDEEAVERSAYDLRWAAALRRPAGRPLCARTTLVLFRARLVLNDAMERLFDQALQHAREQGLLPARALRVILDTRPVIGRGAVEDTYNLIARAMDRLIRRLAGLASNSLESWAADNGFTAYVRRRERSFKGEAEIDWSDYGARQALLRRSMTDARRLLELCAAALTQLDETASVEIREDYDLLRTILAQDVREEPGGQDPPKVEIKEGTAPDRIPSATDPDQRHGHKSQSRRFTGQKARVAVDTESQLIVDVEVVPGNAGDAAGALAQVERIAERIGQDVASTIGDCAFGSGATRKEFADAGQELLARMPGAGSGDGEVPKSRFYLVWEGANVVSVTCPMGKTIWEYEQKKDGGRIFRFGSRCGRCPLRWNCVQAKKLSRGRSIHIHPQEHLLAAARDYQQTEAGKRTFARRVVAEHALARMARFDAGQARYFGRKKTHLQLLMTATVVNLRWTWNWIARQSRPTPNGEPEPTLPCPDSTASTPGQKAVSPRGASERPRREVNGFWRASGPERTPVRSPTPAWPRGPFSAAFCHHF